MVGDVSDPAVDRRGVGDHADALPADRGEALRDPSVQPGRDSRRHRRSPEVNALRASTRAPLTGSWTGVARTSYPCSISRWTSTRETGGLFRRKLPAIASGSGPDSSPILIATART